MDYHKDRFDDFSVLIYKEDKVVAVFPANRVGSELYSHQGLTYGGLILNNDAKFGDALKIFGSILKFYLEQGITNVNFKLIPRIYHKKPSDEIKYLLFKLKAELVRCDVLSVVNPKEMMMSRDRKNGVKRGKKHGLIVKETNDCSSFWNDILKPNLEMKHNVAPVHSLREITLLKQRFPNNIKQFNVYHKDNIVGGTTIFETDVVAHSQYISADGDKNVLGTLDFLHHYLLTKVFNNKISFDFGISNENQGQHINEGLLYWKEGFGARSVAQEFYRVNTKDHNLLNDIML